jgi:hypothetical protein
LSPFSATIVQNYSNQRNDWNFTTIPCGGAAIPALGKGAEGRKTRPQLAWIDQGQPGYFVMLAVKPGT